MVTVWWSIIWLICHTFLNSSGNMTAQKYCQQIEEMHQKQPHICLAMINRQSLIILQYNALQHVTKITLKKLNKLGYEILLHPTYSPDLSPIYFYFFKYLDNYLRGRCFKNKYDVEMAFAFRNKDFFLNRHQ